MVNSATSPPPQPQPQLDTITNNELPPPPPPPPTSASGQKTACELSATKTTTTTSPTGKRSPEEETNNNNTDSNNSNFVVVVDGGQSDKLNSAAAAGQQLDLVTSSAVSGSSGGGGGHDMPARANHGGGGGQADTCCAQPPAGGGGEPTKPQVQNSSSDSISRQQLLPNETTTTTESSAANQQRAHSKSTKNNQLNHEQAQVQEAVNKKVENNLSPLKQPGGIELVVASPSANGIQQRTSNQSATIVIGAGEPNSSAAAAAAAAQLLDSSANSSANNSSRQQQQQQQEPPLAPGNYCKQKRLTYLQLLLIRKWPYLALSICVMGALLFGILLSGLTVLLMHGVQSGDCSAAAAASAGQASPLLSAAHEFGAHRRPLLAADFEAPIEMVAHLSPAAEHLAASGPGGQAAFGSPANGSDQSAVAAATAAASLAPAGPLKAAGQSRFQRLPSAIAPIHYDLFVQPFLYEPFNFTGKVSIRIKCIEATDNITLHALDLDINTAAITLSQLTFANGSASPTIGRRSLAPPKVKAVSQDRHLQHSIIKLDGKLEPGQEYQLAIDFVGFLNDDLAGFYKIKYDTRQSQTTAAAAAAAAGGQQPNGTQAAAAATTTWIAATQFQATDARRAFPCFDEPLYKATFSIKIKHWRNMTSLSNMPIVERHNSADGHWVTDVFEKSHRMSTYLVAFAVTNFESRSEGNISVWTRPGFAHTAEYSLRIAGKLLRYYEDFFGIEYPLPKMDMIALPDFNAGAMENWGLITYRETSMLFDESGSSVANKQRVATVVAHELAHQWFGNLVTPKWWDDLWLNEGFASYVEYLGVDHIEPSWKILDQFATEELQNVFRVDELSSSHQISIPVNDPEEISEIFDHISYAKSASVIRMMHHFLTPEVFKEGLRRYLGALKYSNAEQSDLWAHLTEASRLARTTNSSSSRAVDVAKVMNSWTLQVGYPLVTLTRQYDGSRRAKLDQVRYSPYKLPQQQQLQLKQPQQPEQKWEVPITYTWKSELNFEPNTRIWLHQNDSGPVDVDASQMPASDGDWMLVNLQQVGYYRVNYDLQNWKLLIGQLNRDHRVISTTNRAQLLDDLFELARSGAFDYKFALEATKYLKSERDFLPWDTVLTSFGYIDDMLQRTPIYGQWQDYVSDLIRPYYARYKDSGHWLMQRASPAGRANETSAGGGGGGDDALEQYNLVNAISWACQLDQHCISKAKSLFRNWKEAGKNDINPVVRFTVYCTAIDHGTKDDWNFLWRAYEKEQNSSERDRILKALSCSKQIWILSRYLEWTFNKSKPIRRQDGAYIFRMIAKNNYGRDIAFNFVRERWTTIREHYGKTSFSLGALIRSLSNAMNTQVELNQLMNFYESVKSDVGTGKRSFQNAIEEVETNVLWRNRNYKILEDWLNEARSTNTTNTLLPGQQQQL